MYWKMNNNDDEDINNDDNAEMSKNYNEDEETEYIVHKKDITMINPCLKLLKRLKK